MAVEVKTIVPALRRRRKPPAVAYLHVVVPVAGDADMEAMTIACRLAADREAVVTAVHVIEVPLELPLDAHMFEEDAEAKRLLSDASAVGDLHGVRVEQRVVRDRSAGEALVAVATEAESEIIVLAAGAHAHLARRARGLGSTVEFILNHAPCRVLVAASVNGA
jgi:nucleotide-binding universal stress UspA family protein